ncbi:hypothetical protein HA466_0074370 [Hirschfeldia incana]|nr:hypothetical protein HA466_0074370 [Hirschfeldia incana]
MPISAEETTDFIITPEDRQAAKILVALSRGKRYHPREEGEENSSNKKCKEVDNSKETLMIIKAWNLAKPDPVENIPNTVADLVDQISEPIKKQLTVSDVNEDLRRLMLGKDQVHKKMRPLLTGSEIQRLKEGLDVTVYGPENVVQDMKFKMWSSTPVLTSGWKGFVDACNLEEHCDFLHVWMFRHRETRELCFVIDKTKYSTITKPLGKTISDQIN